MNATLMLVCLAGVAEIGQSGELIFEMPGIQVRRESSESKDFQYLLHNRVYLGKNYPKPKDKADFGNPDVDLSRLPTTYYHAKSPIGVVLQKFNWFPGNENVYAADARLPASLIGMGLDPAGQMAGLWSEPPIAVLGLSVGTLASYARPAQTVHVFERLPAIVKLSLPKPGKERYFSYVQDARDRGACVTVFEGEPRATFAKHGGEKFYQVISIDTFKLPVRTVHKDLMSKEGMQMLMSKLRDDGILCYHISNRYYDLAPILASVAKDLKYACVEGKDNGDWDPKLNSRRDRFSSAWIMVARQEAHLAHLKEPPGLNKNQFIPQEYWAFPKRTDKKFVWTDRGENSFRGVYRSDPDIDRFNELVSDFLIFLSDRVGISSLQRYRYTNPISGFIRMWSQSSAQRMNQEPPLAKGTP